MKKIVFTEEFCQPEKLFPFTLTRQVQDIRIGILTIREKWERYLNMPSFDKFEEDYKDLDRSVIIDDHIGNDIIYLIHGNILPTVKLVRQISKLKHGEFVSIPERESLVYCISKNEIKDKNKINVKNPVELSEAVPEINYPWHLFQLNALELKKDFALITKGRKSQKIPSTIRTVNSKDIFIEKGAKLENCILNAEEGPVYIGKNAVIMDGSIVRGPVAVCDHAVIKMGSKIYGATTIGPYCIAGGEIKNSILFGYSNKAHDGYLGDSVIGEWCNLGAGTSNSNVKNNASDVEVWTPSGKAKVGLKCGVLMGDYSRTAINTSINTSTVIGVCCNIFGNSLTPKYISSFSWGSEGIERYKIEKVFTDIDNWKRLKNQQLTDNEKIILKHIFDHY